MGAHVVCFAVALLGVNFGYQPRPEGGVEYLIQIEPHALEAWKSGQEIRSDIPTKVRDVRSFCITVGTKELPRQLPPPPATPARPAETARTTPFDPYHLPPPSTPVIEPDAASGPVMPAMRPSPDRSTQQPPPAATPRTLPPDPASKPLAEHQAAYVQPPAAPKAEPAPAPASKPEPPKPETTEPTKPWMPLIMTLFALFGSLGGNVFLGWVAWDARTRWRQSLAGPLAA